jgi:hypothetical protein
LEKFDYKQLFKNNTSTSGLAKDITGETGVVFRHEENSFNEFDREPLIPFMNSREGPALAVGDANGDGLEDFFVGSSKFTKPALFFQQPGGSFIKSIQPEFDADSTYEETDAVWIDINKDGFNDLVLASGGNEYYGNSEYLKPRVFVNDGKGNFSKLTNAFDKNIMLTASCVVAHDFTGDGFIDLFFGGRAVPWEYGTIPQSYILKNDGQGKFTDITEQLNNELSKIGFVKHAVLSDLNKDGKPDLVLSLEWGGIVAFTNENGKLQKKIITDKKGWWNFSLPVDVDGDGDVDLLAGNLGLNNRLKATTVQPVKMYYNDFDDNGKKEQVLTYFLGGKEIPFATKDELVKQMPSLKKKYLYAEDFAKATLKEIFGKEKLSKAAISEANYFSNAVLINNGNWSFTLKELPWPAQLAPYNDAVVINANEDERPDIFLAGNFYHSNIQMGEYDADYGTLLLNGGNGNFSVTSLTGIMLKGELRHIRKINSGRKQTFILAKNNDSLRIINLQ